MTTNPLWSPNNKDNNLNKFRNKYIKHLKDKSYKALHDWSIFKKKEFWSSIWDFTKIDGIKKNPIIENEKDFINCTFLKILN